LTTSFLKRRVAQINSIICNRFTVIVMMLKLLGIRLVKLYLPATFNGTDDNSRAIEEPDARKRACPVLNGRVTG